MELYQLFITPFFKTKLKMDNTAMIKKLYDLKEENKKGTPRSNVGGWHSGLDLYKLSTRFKRRNRIGDFFPWLIHLEDLCWMSLRQT